MFEFSNYKLLLIVDNSWWATQLLGIKDTAEKIDKKVSTVFWPKIKRGLAEHQCILHLKKTEGNQIYETVSQIYL